MSKEITQTEIKNMCKELHNKITFDINAKYAISKLVCEQETNDYQTKELLSDIAEFYKDEYAELVNNCKESIDYAGADSTSEKAIIIRNMFMKHEFDKDIRKNVQKAIATTASILDKNQYIEYTWRLPLGMLYAHTFSSNLTYIILQVYELLEELRDAQNPCCVG